MKTARPLASRFHAHDNVLYHNSVSNSMFSLIHQSEFPIGNFLKNIFGCIELHLSPFL